MKRKITFSLEAKLLDQLKEISEQTMIPQSRLVEKSLARVLEEYANKE